MAGRLAALAGLALVLGLVLYAAGLRAQRGAESPATVLIPAGQEGTLVGSGEAEIRYVTQVSVPGAATADSGAWLRSAGLGLLAMSIAAATLVPLHRSNRLRTRMGSLLAIPGAFAWWNLLEAANAGPGQGSDAVATLQSAGIMAAVSVAVTVGWGRAA